MTDEPPSWALHRWRWAPLPRNDEGLMWVMHVCDLAQRVVDVHEERRPIDDVLADAIDRLRDMLNEMDE